MVNKFGLFWWSQFKCGETSDSESVRTNMPDLQICKSQCPLENG